jgi:outer membrane protein assembly factor BamB
VFAEDTVIFGAAGGRLLALDNKGKPVWEYAATGAITVDPTADNGRLYFGTEDRSLYCLNAATGKKLWSRRLQGAPLHPALIHGRRLVVPASNSVVYFLSRKGGSILSWEAVPSRIVHEMAAAGPLILISSAAPSLTALDFSTGKRVGQHLASGPLAAGALWVPPFIVLVLGDEESGRQRLVLLRPRPAAASGAAGTRSPGH